MSQNLRFASTWFRFFFILLLSLGIFFRFINLDRKVYWQDETVTSLRISGSSWSQVVRQNFDGHEIGIDDLQKHLHINSEKKLINTLKSTAQEEPQISPLYYALARFWVQCFGDSIAVIRSFSAFTSLLVFPCIYWLCLELFESSLTGWVAVVLTTVSPFHVLYAQEARMYSLWIVMLLLSSAALLRAIRLKTKYSWVIYTITLVLALYSHLLSGLIAIGHGIYLSINERFRFNRNFTSYIVALSAALLSFAPWSLIILFNYAQFRASTGSLNKETPFSLLLNRWISRLSSIFFDSSILVFNDVPNGVKNSIIYICFLPILFFILYSIYFIISQTHQRIWLFILALGGPIFLIIILPSFLRCRAMAGVIRYQISCLLSIQLAVAHLLSIHLQAVNSSQRKIYQVIFALLIAFGVLSCVASSQAEAWWNKGDGYKNLQVARLINQSQRPLLISNDNGSNTSNILSLSYILEQKVRFQLVVDPSVPNIPKGFSEVFLFNPSELLRNKIEKEQNYKTESIKPENLNLWKLANYPS